MKIIIEDFNGNDLCSFKAYKVEGFKNCNVADIDEDENGIEYIRIQIEEKNEKETR